MWDESVARAPVPRSWSTFRTHLMAHNRSGLWTAKAPGSGRSWSTRAVFTGSWTGSAKESNRSLSVSLPRCMTGRPAASKLFSTCPCCQERTRLTSQGIRHLHQRRHGWRRCSGHSLHYQPGHDRLRLSQRTGCEANGPIPAGNGSQLDAVLRQNRLDFFGVVSSSHRRVRLPEEIASAAFGHDAVTVGCDQLARGVAVSGADDDDGERRHTTIGLARLFPWFGPYSGVPALAVKTDCLATGLEASLAHPYPRVTPVIAHSAPWTPSPLSSPSPFPPRVPCLASLPVSYVGIFSPEIVGTGGTSFCQASSCASAPPGLWRRPGL